MDLRINFLLTLLSCFVGNVMVRSTDDSHSKYGKMMGQDLTDIKIKAAIAGVELIPVGTGVSFQRSWDHLLSISLPNPHEYLQILNDMKMDCNLIEKEKFRAYSNGSNSDPNLSMDLYFYALTRRCLDFQQTVQKKAVQMISDAFSHSLPQPRSFTPTEVGQFTRLKFIVINSRSEQTKSIMTILRDQHPDFDMNWLQNRSNLVYLSKRYRILLNDSGQITPYGFKVPPPSAFDNIALPLQSGSDEKDDDDDYEDDVTTSVPTEQTVSSTLASTTPLVTRVIDASTTVRDDSREFTNSIADSIENKAIEVETTTETPTTETLSSELPSSVTPTEPGIELKTYGLSQKRRKRVWGWIVGSIVTAVFSAGIGVGLGISYQASIDNKRFELLEAKITRLLELERYQDTHSVSLRESLIGYTNVTKNQFEILKRKQSIAIKVTQVNLSTQVNSLSRQKGI